MKKLFLIVLMTYFHPNTAYNYYASSVSYTIDTSLDLEEESKRPTYILHGNTGFSGYITYNFYDKHIFFGKDKSGKPIYKRIFEHAADNSKFGKVMLVLYYPKKRYPKQFVIIGTYSNHAVHKKLFRRMQTLFGYPRNGAVWCPEQNAIIAGIDGSSHNESAIIDVLEMSKKFEQWLKQQKKK